MRGLTRRMFVNDEKQKPSHDAACQQPDRVNAQQMRRVGYASKEQKTGNACGVAVAVKDALCDFQCGGACSELSKYSESSQLNVSRYG